MAELRGCSLAQLAALNEANARRVLPRLGTLLDAAA
jgi:hypothetical protein